MSINAHDVVNAEHMLTVILSKKVIVPHFKMRKLIIKLNQSHRSNLWSRQRRLFFHINMLRLCHYTESKCNIMEYLDYAIFLSHSE